MKNSYVAWALAGLVAFSGVVRAQDAPSAQKKDDDKHEHEDTVKKEDVRTWILTQDNQEYEAHPATPAYEGETGLFHMSTAYTLGKGKASVSVFRDTLERDPKDIDFVIYGLSLAYGATDRLELFGNIGFQNRNDADALFQGGFWAGAPFTGAAPTGDPSWQSGFGDVKFGAKYKFLDDYLGDAVGLAARAYVKLGTADATLGLGTGKPSFGGELILSKNINRSADIHVFAGYTVNSNPDMIPAAVPVIFPAVASGTSLKVGNEFRWGFGINVPSCTKFQLQAEVVGSAYSSSDFKQTNPVDLVVGPVVFFKPGIFLRAAFMVNLAYNYGNPNQGVASYSNYQVSVGYHPGTPCRKVYTPPPPPPPQANRNPTVQCEVERPTIQPGETTRVRAVASDPDGDPLTYEWSASAGKISGTGAEAVYDSNGVPAPSSVSVSVRVSDGRGGTAESRCSVNVQAPQTRVEPTRCSSGGFPRDLSRLNNVDKACNDDVASRMKRDPRSRVIIVGYADSQERYPQVISRKRAEEVKQYLVKEQGIDESRITAKGAGAVHPVDTGATAAAHARNRRVEVIFVPEGAAAPETD